ncbi:hypothetical protein K388_07092 [Streptomyces sp. KhCrAH-43]|uniref:zinc finger domain-containing protein n=1 Tax=unclassified Streptomyces TaxID=2593676 RepID=UPI0003A1AA8F|nr:MULTISPECIES: hypothetical protein [unclassified Streptomyces]RAJ47855.1 hypothetical protein K388_07092 [Streptomyces sp. KhCrAH-43]
MPNHNDTAYETTAESDVAHLMEGRNITLDEIAVELASIELRLRQVAFAAETPATPVELEPMIDSLRFKAGQLRELSDEAGQLARIVEGDVPLATKFSGVGDPWGAAARGTNREHFGGPAVVPTARQLIHLAHGVRVPGTETTTYPEAMAGMQLIWESKSAQARRRRERDAAVEDEVLVLECETCEAEPGEHCVTKSGRVSERPHTKRRRTAETNVDARLGYLGGNPAGVPDSD